MAAKLLARFKARRLGGHTHIEVLIGRGEKIPEDKFSHLGLSGTLTLKNEDWKLLKELLEYIPSQFFLARISEEEE